MIEHERSQYGHECPNAPRPRTPIYDDDAVILDSFPCEGAAQYFPRMEEAPMPPAPTPCPSCPLLEPPSTIQPPCAPPHHESCMEVCCLDLPYPPARACRKDPHAARMIQSAYAGCGSELTAILQYLYASMLFAPGYPDASRQLSCIARCEMHHFRLLGDLLVSLGCEPKYCVYAQHNSGWWSAQPSNVNYPTQFGGALLDNISGEKKAIEHYRRILCAVEDEEIGLLLRRIILDEERHIEILSALYERLCS